MIGKKTVAIIFSIFLSHFAFSQQISIAAYSADTYGNGGNITVPLSVTGCFRLDNQFRIYLSDASGSFSNATQIGSYNSFFATYINGKIPAGTPAGNNYKVRIVSTSPATSVESGAFSISGTNLPVVTNPQTSGSNTINDSTFGRCLITSNQLLTLQETVPAGYTLVGIVKDGAENNITSTTSASQLSFTMVPGNYYTVTIKLKNSSDNTVSAKSFLVLATTNNLSLQTSGATDVCLPDTKAYTINITGNGGIKNNYPGTQYSIEWGDGTINTYTHCELVGRDGSLLHDYTNTSCGQPPITDLNPIQYNAFRVNVKARNDFCPNSFTSITTYSKVWQKPKADFVNPVYGCLNTPITFPNKSQAGLSGYNNVVNCINVAVYEWYVDGNLIFNALKDLTYTFTTTGMHTVRLVAVNDPCSDEITKEICIEEPLKPDFKVNGQDSVSGCAPLTVSVDNITTFGNGYQCRPTKWKWQVLLRPSLQPAVAGVDYTIQPNDSATNPSFTFLRPAGFFVRLTVGNACGNNYKDVPVTITDVAGVSFNFANKKYCGTKTIDFATDPNHRPTYNSNSGAETYQWTISGGRYTFTGGTSSSSAYPKIEFDDFATYTINLQFTNSCGTKTASQQIIFDAPVTATAINDTTLCNSATLLQLNASSTGPVNTGAWSIVTGSGSLSATSISNPTYTFSTADKTNQKVTVRYTASPASGSACAAATDDVNITLLPNNVVTSSPAKPICSASSVNYAPSALAGSSYSWTSSVVSGSVTGNAASGTGNINDVLTNTSSSANAVVKYTITPFLNGCTGQVFNLTVTVIPKPDLQVTPSTDTICTGTSTNISLSSSYPSALYKWTATVASGTVTGFSDQAVPLSNNKISEVLINTGSTLATVTYTITSSVANTSCNGDTKTVTVAVRPGATVANAGKDQVVCDQSTVALNGNEAMVGSGFWKQVAGPATTIVNANAYNTSVNGLQADSTYSFVWTISGLGQCPSTSDTVKIFNRPAVTSANAGSDIVVCDFVTTGSVTLNGNADANKPFEKHEWTIVSQPTNGNGTLSNPTAPASTFSFNAAGTYQLAWTISNDAGCPPTKANIAINVFEKPFAGPISGNTNICVGNDVTVTVANRTGKIKKWQYNPAPVADNVWKDTLVTTSTINFLSVADTFAVRVIVESAGASFGCTSTDTSNQIIINAAPGSVPGTTGPDNTVCKSINSGNITLKGNTGKIVRWESSTDNGSTWTSIANTTTLLNYSNLTATTIFRAVVESGNCGLTNSTATTINVLPAVTPAIAGADQLICNSSTVLEGNKPSPGELGKWKQIAGPSNAALSDDAAPVVTVSSLVPGTYNFVWTVSNGTCSPSADTLVVNVRPAITPANAGNDTVICDFVSNGLIKLNGQNSNPDRVYEIKIWRIISQPTSSTATFTDAADANAVFHFNAPGTYQLEWSIANDAGCNPTKDTVTITAVQKPVAGKLTAKTVVCAGSDVAVNMGVYTGVIKKWQYNPAPINDNIWIDTTVTSSNINFLSVNDTFSVRAIVESNQSSLGCYSTDTSNAIVINVIPATIPGTTGADQTVCKGSNSGNIQLKGNIGNVQKWEYSEDGSTWTLINNSTTTFNYKDLTTTTSYRALVESGICGPLPSSPTKITVLNPVTNAVAGEDQILCAAATANLAGNNAAAGEIVSWKQIKGTNVVFSSTTVANPTISDLQPGTYSFVYTITNGVCPATTDTVNITVNAALVNTIDNADKVICSSQSVTILGQNAAGGSGQFTYEWESSTDGITWIKISGEFNRDITVIPTTNIYLRRIITSLPCRSVSAPVLINVQSPIANNNISSDQKICINTPSALLNGSLPSGATGAYAYEWQQSIDTGKTWVTIPASNTGDFDPAILRVTTSYRRNVTSGYCIGAQSNSSNVVTIVVNPDTKADFTYTKDINCPPFLLDNTIITATDLNSTNATYNWYANNKLIGTGIAFPGYTLGNSNDSVTIRLITVSSFGCKDDTIEHKFFTKRTVSQPAFASSATEGCGPLTVSFANQTRDAGYFTYKWNFGNGITSTSANPGDVVFKVNPEYGDTIYKVSLTAYSACDSLTVYQNIKVRSAVQALFKPDRVVGCSPMTVNFTNYSEASKDFTWNFDDGTVINTAQAGVIQHTFTSAVQDTFRVSLIARSECGSDTQYHSIVISPNKIRLLLTINGDQKSGCSPHTVQLINNSKGATSFKWDLGDGNVLTTAKNIDTIKHEYVLPGTYTVRLFASNGCSDTATTETVTVYTKPVVDFSLQPSTVCLGDTTHFTNLSDTITGATWDFGDGTSSNLINPKHVYTAPGVYKVALIGVRQYPSGNACIDSAHHTATVISSLPGTFTMSDSVGNCTPFTVTFTNKNLPSKLTTWDFGDGKKDTGDIVKHTFVTTGTFNVTMTAIHPGGCKYQDGKKVVVNGPAGSFTYNNALKCDNSPVRFEAAMSGIDSVRWDFGDGTYSNSKNDLVYHSYAKQGNYIPSVTLFAGASCSKVLTGPDTIRVDFIKAGFREALLADCGNTRVSFKDTSRAFSNIASCAWKFGDGATDSVQHPTHSYKAANTWMVQLISISKYGCRDTVNKAVPVTLNAPPVASIISTNQACANSRINYSSSVVSTDSVLSYRWIFTNGYNTNGTSATNVYANAGNYNAILIVSTINGCVDTVSKAITINPAPAINANPDQMICLGQSLQLSVSGGTSYSWGPINNLSCINCSSPIASPVTTTRYTVKGFNSYGCQSVDTVTVYVSQPFKIKPSLSDTVCLGQATQLFAAGADRYKWSPSSGLNNTEIYNPLAKPSLTTSYRVIGSDSNSCFTDTAYLTVTVGKYPTVNVGPDKVLSSGSVFHLTPVITNGPIAKWVWYPANDLSCNNCEAPTAEIKKDITYSVTATNEYGCSATDSINIKVFCESSHVFIPNVFTPDGDGVNDVLMVRGAGINSVKSFRIFNRWGEVVFERANFSLNEKSNGWDGTVRGVKAPTDVYVYTCEVLCENGDSFVYKGNVTIIK